MKKITNKLAKFRSRKLEESEPDNVPRITTKTVAEHREEVIGSARKYIYPLQHSKHKILIITSTVLIFGVISFFVFCTLALYRLNNTSTFMYRVTQVIPFPVAKAGSRSVNYENYLFEIRHYIHYYENQQRLDFSTKEGREQLEAFRRQALDKVVNDAFVRQLADKYKISVSEKEVDEEIAVVREQNRLGSNDQVFEEVLKDYWGWSVNDFRRTLKGQLLAQKVVATLDTETIQRANSAHGELEAGADFAKVAKAYSDDTATKNSGGELGIVDRSNRDVTAKTVDVLYGLKEGEHSGVVNIGYSLQIIKNVKNASDNKREAAHILFNFKDISVYLNDIKDQQKAQYFIKH